MFSARKLDLSALTDIEEDVETSASEEEQGRGEEIDDDGEENEEEDQEEDDEEDGGDQIVMCLAPIGARCAIVVLWALLWEVNISRPC